MGQYRITGVSAFNQNCITGENDHLYQYLKEAIARAREIDINVSFLMESGVRLILDDLKTAADRGVKIRILCGSYLNITSPTALYLLKDALGDRADLRFYSVPNKSFHAKAYFFRYADYDEVFVAWAFGAVYIVDAFYDSFDTVEAVKWWQKFWLITYGAHYFYAGRHCPALDQ